MHKFKIKSGANGHTHVQFVYNSEIMVWSESYSAKASAQNCIDSIKQNAPGAPIVDLTNGDSGSGYRFEIDKAANGEHYVRFKASNGETMVRSETYSSKRAAESCAESVKKNAPEAPVEDA